MFKRDKNLYIYIYIYIYIYYCNYFGYFHNLTVWVYWRQTELSLIHLALHSSSSSSSFTFTSTQKRKGDMVVVVPLDCFSFHHCLRNHTTQLSLSSRSTTSTATTSTLHFHYPIIQAKLPFFTNSDSFQVGRPIGTYGFINITRYLLLHNHSNENKRCNQFFFFP